EAGVSLTLRKLELSTLKPALLTYAVLTGVTVTCMSAADDWTGRTIHVEPAAGTTVELPAITHGDVPWMTVLLPAIVTVPARELTCTVVEAATKPTCRTASPYSVEAGSAATTRAT